MERLTFSGDFCDIAQCFEIRGGKQCPDGYCSQRRVWERLKEFEDTELEPEKVAFLKRVMDDAFSDSPEFTEHLRELVRNENAGRLVVLPVSVGDTVYVIPSKANYALNILSRHPENNRIYEQPVREVRFYSGGVFLMITCDGTQAVHSKFFGETWFLTREDAEAALEAQKGNKADG